MSLINHSGPLCHINMIFTQENAIFIQRPANDTIIAFIITSPMDGRKY